MSANPVPLPVEGRSARGGLSWWRSVPAMTLGSMSAAVWLLMMSILVAAAVLGALSSRPYEWLSIVPTALAAAAIGWLVVTVPALVFATLAGGRWAAAAWIASAATAGFVLLLQRTSDSIPSAAFTRVAGGGAAAMLIIGVAWIPATIGVSAILAGWSRRAADVLVAEAPSLPDNLDPGSLPADPPGER